MMSFGHMVATLVNSILLTVVYIVGVGFTTLLFKLKGKKALDMKLDAQKKSYWKDLNLSKKEEDEYFKQY